MLDLIESQIFLECLEQKQISNPVITMNLIYEKKGWRNLHFV